MTEKRRRIPRTDDQKEVEGWRRTMLDDEAKKMNKVVGAEKGNVPTFDDEGGLEDNDIGVEDIQTYFADNAVFFADNGFPKEDVSNFGYDNILKLLSIINVFSKSLRLNTASPQAYLAGQISYDPVSKTNLSDTGIPGVRVNIGQETHVRIYNNSGVDWLNGQSVMVSTGVTDSVVNGILTNSLIVRGHRIGVCTSDITDGSWGLVALYGEVRGYDLSLFANGDILYLGETNGTYTTVKPLYPRARIIVGEVSDNSVDGILVVFPLYLDRANGSRSYSFTSNGIGAGIYYVGGNYESALLDTTLTQASLTQTFGAANVPHGSHAFAVFGGAGTVDAGQVGLRVNGTSFTDAGVRTALDSETITEDITTVALNEYLETDKKWLGTIEYELFTVTGAPTTYSVDFNYGFAKYEDLENRDFTITSFEAVGLAGANDTNFNIELLHHTNIGWTYAAAGFVPGNGTIVSWTDDQAPEDDLVNNDNFAYKRAGLSSFIEGSLNEGAIVRITTGANNSVQAVDVHVAAFLEDLPF